MFLKMMWKSTAFLLVLMSLAGFSTGIFRTSSSIIDSAPRSMAYRRGVRSAGIDCISDERQSKEYRGTLDIASSNLKCLYWKNYPRVYERHWTAEEAIEHMNYCRNPNNDKKGPWCIIATGQHDYCNVPKCPEDIGCYDGRGDTYFGAQDRSESGKICMPWIQHGNSQYSRSQYNFIWNVNQKKADILPQDDKLVQQFRACRNPQGSRLKPWCMVYSEDRPAKLKEYCHVPLCSDPSNLVYPKLHPKGSCAIGFTTDIAFWKVGKRMIVVDHCVAPYRTIYRRNRIGHYHEKFNDFCFFLTTPFAVCPYGFREFSGGAVAQMDFTHQSGPSILKSVNHAIQYFLCCSQSEYFSNKTTTPYMSVLKSSKYKDRGFGFRHSKLHIGPFGTDVGIDTDVEELPMRGNTTGPTSAEIFTNYTLETLDLNPPIFASVLQCPYVTATIRVVFSTARIDKSEPLGILPSGVVCEYYPEGRLEEEKTNNAAYQLALLVNNNQDCSTGFRATSLSRDAMLLLGLNGNLCVLGETQSSRQPLHNTRVPNIPGYCYLVVKTGIQTEEEWNKRSTFKCPYGFQENEIHMMEPKLLLQFCCSIPSNSSQTIDKPATAPVPFGIRGPFSVIKNGDRCPLFESEDGNLTVTESARSLDFSYFKNMAVIGEGRFLHLSNVVREIVMCNYLSPEVQLAVSSLAIDCDGLGVKLPSRFETDLCAFSNDRAISFPPGRYCFRALTSNCPQGFTLVRKPAAVFGAIQSSCCRNEETIGAIKLPLPLKAPFKLPAIYSPCQQILDFTVDAELSYCVYYPRGNISQAIIVWPKVVGEDPDKKGHSRPSRCLSESNRVFESWLTQRRSRWNKKPYDDTSSACLDEMAWYLLPRSTSQGNSYCLFVLGACQSPDFTQIGASPFMEVVICCTKDITQRTNLYLDSDADNDAAFQRPPVDGTLRSLVTLGYPTESDLQTLSGVRGAKILPRDMGNASESGAGCPQFPGLTIIRRVAHGMTALNIRNDSGEEVSDAKLLELFNVTSMQAENFKQKTGIWVKSGVVHLIYCEYQLRKVDPEEANTVVWPNGNYAIPKSLSDCPQSSKRVSVIHIQDEVGFHYSEPIHLDGMYLQGHRFVSIDYCVFKPDPSRPVNRYPEGHYCLLRVDGWCGPGFTEGAVTISESPIEDIYPLPVLNTGMASEEAGLDIHRVHSQSKDKPSRREYNFCCRADSPSVDIPMSGLPADKGSFYLYKLPEKCQAVEGMRYTEEFICMNAESSTEELWRPDRNPTNSTVWKPFTIKGLTPVRVLHEPKCEIQINLCYYQPDFEVVKETKAHNMEEWPVGDYALIGVHHADDESGCPPGFTSRHGSLFELTHNIPDLDLIPITLLPYFVELEGHNLTSMLGMHFCVRDTRVNVSTGSEPWHPLLQMNTLPPTMTEEDAILQWPAGDYCVISTAYNSQCPPGLHRHARAIKDFCCRTDDIEDPTPVKWKFINDFFLISREKCLPVEGTHVERYLAHLTTRSRRGNQWDILCHYLPAEWFEKKPLWPPGNYMLPIGRRGGLKSMTLTTTVKSSTDSLPQDLLGGEDRQSGHYRCPDTFERNRFTFLSQAKNDYDVPILNSTKSKTKDVQGMVSIEFCVQQRNESAPLTNDSRKSKDRWPPGDYCVFAINSECPRSMRASSEVPLKISGYLLHWIDRLDENGTVIGQKKLISKPSEHVFYITQCCREDYRLILQLPASTDDGFYLASTPQGMCSHIPHMQLSRERVTNYFTTPLSDQSTTTTFFSLRQADVYLHTHLSFYKFGVMNLCYYHPTKGFDFSKAILGPKFSSSLELSDKDIQQMAESCGCAENAMCTLHRSQDCVCKPGYFGDGRHQCVEVTPLTDDCADLCDRAAVCADNVRYKYDSKKQAYQSSHACVCRSGYSGDGFSCRPDCGDHRCQPFSRCVHDYVSGTVQCKCIKEAVASGDRCHLDMYRTLHHRKDLPQFLVQHDHCLSPELQEILMLSRPGTFFYLFVPITLMKTCDDLRAHLVTRTTALTDVELQATSASSKMTLRTINDTVIEVYLQNGTLYVDGNSTKATVSFTNGNMYYLMAPLLLKPYVKQSRSYIALAILLVALGLAVAIVIILVWRGVIGREHFYQIRRPVMLRRTFNADGDQDLLVQE